MWSPRRLAPDLLADLPGSVDPPPPTSLFWTMWRASTATAHAALQTGFIQGIGAGTLDPVTYGGFNVNDAYYCFNGADDYQGAAARATDPGLQAFLTAKYQSYQQYNETFPTVWRVRDASGLAPYTACILYSLYEGIIAETAPPIYALIVMIPCEYLWAWIASELPAPPPSNLYGPWITENNDPSGAYKMGNYLDTYMAANPGAVDQNDALTVYQAAMSYEVQNFQAANDPTDPALEMAALDDDKLRHRWEDTLRAAGAAPSGVVPPLHAATEERRNRAAHAELIKRGLVDVPSDWRRPPA